MIDNLLKLARQVHELEVPLSTLISAARLNDFMKARGLSASRLKDYLRMCDKHRQVFDNFARKAIDFFLLEEKTGKTYEEIQKDHVRLTQEKVALEQDIIKLKSEKTDVENEMVQELASHGLLRKEIPYAQKLKEVLSDYGFTIEDTLKVPKFIKEIYACREDAKLFLRRADREETLEEETIKLYGLKKELTPLVESLNKQRVNLEGEVKTLADKKQELLQTNDQLEKRNKNIKKEAETLDAEISFARCVVALLNNEEAGCEALFSNLNKWKQLLFLESPDRVATRKQCQQNAKKIIIQTFLKYYKDDLAPKDELTKAQRELEETKEQNSALSTGNIQLQEKNKSLSAENIDLKKKLELANKDIEHYMEMILSDPSIRQKTETKLPSFP